MQEADIYLYIYRLDFPHHCLLFYSQKYSSVLDARNKVDQELKNIRDYT